MSRLRGWIGPVVAGAIGLLVIFSAAYHRSTPYNNYVFLADAWLHGRMWINAPGTYLDAVPYHGHLYIIEAPLPAIFLLPVVALFHGANQTQLSILIGGIGVGAAWALARRLGASIDSSIWLVAFMFAGTDFWWCAMLGDVWFIAHVFAVTFTLLALVELAGKRRAWIVALCAACAFESRFTMVMALPVYVYLALRDGDRAFVRRQVIGFAAVLVPVALLWVGYNEARWGTWNDLGYSLWYHQDAVGSPVGSPFQLQYFRMQLISFFALPPEWLGKWPWFNPDQFGTALTFTSPALIFAFWAREPRSQVLALWAAVLLTAGPNFIYYVNGFDQFGMRHALDFEPFLFALMALAARRSFPWWSQVLIAYSVAVGAWGVWFWNTFIRNTS